MKVVKDIGDDPVVLHAFSHLLYTVGSTYAHDGIGWLSTMLAKIENVASGGLEESTVVYLEAFIRRYISENRRLVKTSLVTKQKVLAILDFLIDKASVAAYLAREDIL